MLKPGLRYSHIGIPTKERTDLPIYLEGCKVHINDFNDEPYAVEWLNFEEGSPFPEILQKQAHVAYECDDLEEAMKLAAKNEDYDLAVRLRDELKSRKGEN